MFWDGLSFGVVERQAEGLLIDHDAVDQAGFVQQVAEIVCDVGFEAIEFFVGLGAIGRLARCAERGSQIG